MQLPDYLKGNDVENKKSTTEKVEDTAVEIIDPNKPSRNKE